MKFLLDVEAPSGTLRARYVTAADVPAARVQAAAIVARLGGVGGSLHKLYGWDEPDPNPCATVGRAS